MASARNMVLFDSPEGSIQGLYAPDLDPAGAMSAMNRAKGLAFAEMLS